MISYNIVAVWLFSAAAIELKGVFLMPSEKMKSKTTQTTNEQAVEHGTVSPVDLPDSAGNWIKRVCYGALVGVGAVLPGVSGGAFCAAFGIYRPMMDFFAHPTKKFKQNIKFFLPFLIGCGLGFVLLSGLVSKLLAVAGAIVTAFFVGCIGGTMPSLYHEADGKNWKPLHWGILVASTGLTIWGLLAMNKMANMEHLIANPKSLTAIITWVVCGIVFALGAIVPGMSPSSLIMYAELYEPMTAGIGALDFNILLPFILGVVLCIICLSKLISWLFNSHGSSMFAFVIGVVIASTVLVAYNHVILEAIASGFWYIIGSILAAAAGFALVIVLARLDPRSKEA